MKLKIWLAMGVAVGMATMGLYASTLSVTSNADSGEGTLRELINTCASGDVIEIPEGMEIKIESVMSRTNKTITVKGLGTGATINGQGKTPFYFLRTGWGQIHTFSMENLTFTNCTSATGGVIKSDGGGTQGTNHYRARKCNFVGNSATTGGGVICNGATWVIDECYFARNSAPVGAVCPLIYASLYITNSIFRFNTAGRGTIFGDSGNYPQPGGNLYAYGCDFSCNVATNGSGAFANKVFKIQEIRHCTFTNNTSSTGTCIFSQGSSNSSSVLYEDSVMDHNTTGGEGGVFGNTCTTPIVVRCCKISNTTAQRCCVGGGSGCGQYLQFEHCLIENNVSTTGASWWNAGMFGYNQKTSKLEFSDCIIRGNKNLGGGDGVLLWTYNVGTNCVLRLKSTLLEGNYSKGSISLMSGGGFNLEIDDCTFKNNGISPDGVYTNSYLMKLETSSCSRHLRNCTFVGNWGAGTTWQSYGLIENTFKSTFDDAGQPITFLDVDHCTFVSNYMRKTANSSPTILNNSATTNGLRITNCAFADNFDTAGADLKVREAKAGTTAMSNCVLTATTTIKNLEKVEQSVASSEFKFKNFGDNGTRTTLYGNEKLPTWSIGKGSCLIDAGTGSLAADERGFARDAKPDIGAFEYISPIGLLMFVR